jgi:3-hydroxybutyryl-CoA dehydrogenase
MSEGPTARPLPAATIAVIGAGIMGHGIAQLFAMYGYDVRLTDNQETVRKAALERIQQNLRLLAANGNGAESEAATILARIALAASLEEAVADAGFVVEAVYEQMALKHAVLQAIEAACRPDAIIASNSSSFRVGEMAAVLKQRGRFLGTHYWNPPHVMPLVEVIRGEQTEPQVVTAMCDLLRSVGRYPAVVHKDVAGFVGNRLQHALRREAIALVEAGVASVEDVDLIARLSFGLRLPLLGPLEVADLSGVDLTHSIQSYLLPDLSCADRPSALVVEKVAQGKLGIKSGEGFYQWTEEGIRNVLARRDQGVMELLQWLQERQFLPSMPTSDAPEAES